VLPHSAPEPADAGAGGGLATAFRDPQGRLTAVAGLDAARAVHALRPGLQRP
jgi:hypothetical protein